MKAQTSLHDNKWPAGGSTVTACAHRLPSPLQEGCSEFHSEHRHMHIELSDLLRRPGQWCFKSSTTLGSQLSHNCTDRIGSEMCWTKNRPSVLTWVKQLGPLPQDIYSVNIRVCKNSWNKAAAVLIWQLDLLWHFVELLVAFVHSIHWIHFTFDHFYAITC